MKKKYFGNDNRINRPEFIPMIILIMVIVYIAYPYVNIMYENAKKQADQYSAQGIAKAATYVFAIYGEYAHPNDEFNLGDDEIEEVDLEILKNLKNEPVLRTYKDRQFVVRVLDNGGIIVTDNLGQELYPNLSKDYEREAIDVW